MAPLLERFLTSAAAAAALASLMPLAARLGWAFDLASHFRVQYFVADVLLAIVLLARGKLVFSIVLAGCAALSAWAVLPYVAFAPQVVAPAAAGAPTIKLLAANVLYRNHSAARLLEIVRRESPDVVLLDEYTPEWAAQVDELRTAYPHYFERPRGDPYGIALFSRYSLDAAQPFALGDTTAIEARVRTPDGPLTVIGVHLRSPVSPARGAMRNLELDELAARVSSVARPVAVIGDFNLTPYSPFFADWLAHTGLTDTRRGRTLAPSWPTLLPIAAIPIDHCAVSRDVLVIAHRSLPAFGSDHYPILAELKLAPPPPSQN
jgi:endonuclease/exonuclease/phosphatase (EEP) superfamily protein YafD